MPSADFCVPIGSPLGFRSPELRDETQTSRGKSDRFHRTPAGSTALALDGSGLRDSSSARPAKDASYPVSVRQVAVLIHASSRPRLATAPLRFTSTSLPSSCTKDFHLLAVRHARHTTKRPLAALEQALEGREPEAGLIHHSDQGRQYASRKYVDKLTAKGVKISMSRRGNPYDNAFVESFMKTLKAEEVDCNEYATLAQAQAEIGGFIERIYNRKRLHSSLGYVPPAEFEEAFAAIEGAKTAA